MGEKACSPPAPAPAPAPAPPPLLFRHSQDYEKMIFSSIGDEKYHLVQALPPALRGKQIQAYCHGWFILLEEDPPKFWNFLFPRKRYYSLWNPLTSEWICFPPLRLKYYQEIERCILSSPPGNPDCLLMLFEKKVPSFIFCKVGMGDNQWTHQTIDPRLRDDKNDFLTDPVICNGALYCHTVRLSKLVKIELNMPDGILPLVLFDQSIPLHQENSTRRIDYMLESCGELFFIYLVLRASYFPRQVISVEVIRLDFSIMAWKKVESIQNRAFFLGPRSSFSCIADSSVPGIKGNHVYFTCAADRCLYSFNIDDKTVSVSLACPNLRIPLCSSIWIMPDLRLSNMLSQTKSDLRVERKEIKVKPPENRAMVKYAEVKQAEWNFGKLPTDMLFAIGKSLRLHDYMNFRSVNKRFRLAAPPIPWTSAALEALEGYNSLLPWLMICRKGDDICSFNDLWGRKFLMENPNNQLKNVTRHYSREGWCMMLQDKHSIFLWNPFLKEIIQLPTRPHEGFPILCVSFSSSIGWVVFIGYGNGHQYIEYIFLEEGEWHSLHTVELIPIFCCNILTFYDGAFYTFDKNGMLFAFKEGGFKFFKKAKKPCPSHQSFLVECDGKLLSVFVGFMGQWVRIFRLNESNMVWVEVENLGNYTIYVSHYSSFAIPATCGMENRVYFPRFSGKNAVYYSLGSKKLHSHGTETVLNNFLNTKEQLYSSWIQPKWL